MYPVFYCSLLLKIKTHTISVFAFKRKISILILGHEPKVDVLFSFNSMQAYIKTKVLYKVATYY